MIKFAAAICAVAAMIFIGQFVWSFKQDADARAAAEQAQFEQIVNDRLKRVANGE